MSIHSNWQPDVKKTKKKTTFIQKPYHHWLIIHSYTILTRTTVIKFPLSIGLCHLIPKFFRHKLFFVPSPLSPCAVRKSMISFAAFLGRSSDTEWPQLSIRSTWQFGSAACSTAAPVMCSTCERRRLTKQQIQLEHHIL